MAGIEHNAYQVAERLERVRENVRLELTSTLDRLAQEVALAMGRNVPKFQSHLWESIHVESTGEFRREIKPGMAYAGFVERGVRPGGKGLPRFDDPASADIVKWLENKAYSGARANTRLKRFYRDLDLRDRYEGLVWSVRKFGTKAQPFVKPTREQMAGRVFRGIRDAMERGLQGGKPAGAAA